MAAAVYFRAPHVVAGCATELAIKAVGLVQGVTYILELSVARGGDVVHLDQTSLTWSRDMAGVSGDTRKSTHMLPPLTAGEHTVRATLLDAAVLPEGDAMLATSARSILIDSNAPATCTSARTIVTAYFNITSKHSSAAYSEWMTNMLSLQDAMVIYTTPSMISQIMHLRKHATARTKVISMELNQTRMARVYDKAFWARQHALDPERNKHADYRLYWIWNEKTEWLQRTVEENPFNSSFFAWVDIGYFRDKQYNGQVMLKITPSALGPNQVLMLNVQSLAGGLNYVGGGFIGGYAPGITKWHHFYYRMIDQNKHHFIGKDQPWMWKTCESHAGLCELVVPDHGTYIHGLWFYMTTYFERLFQIQTSNEL